MMKNYSRPPLNRNPGYATAWRGVNLLNAGRVRVYYQISILISDIIYVLIICNFF